MYTGHQDGRPPPKEGAREALWGGHGGASAARPPARPGSVLPAPVLSPRPHQALQPGRLLAPAPGVACPVQTPARPPTARQAPFSGTTEPRGLCPGYLSPCGSATAAPRALGSLPSCPQLGARLLPVRVPCDPACSSTQGAPTVGEPGDTEAPGRAAYVGDVDLHPPGPSPPCPPTPEPPQPPPLHPVPCLLPVPASASLLAY